VIWIYTKINNFKFSIFLAFINNVVYNKVIVKVIEKGKYMKVSFKGKKFEVRNKSIKIAK